MIRIFDFVNAIIAFIICMPIVMVFADNEIWANILGLIYCFLLYNAVLNFKPIRNIFKSVYRIYYNFFGSIGE